MNITSKITKYRENLHLSKSALAKELGLSPAMITNYENGKKQPSLKTLLKLSQVLSVPLEYFVTDKDYIFQVACRNTACRDKKQLKEIAELCKIVDNYQSLMTIADIKMKYEGPSLSFNQKLKEENLKGIKDSLELPDIVDFQSLAEAIEKHWKIPVFRIPFDSPKLSGLTIKRQEAYFIFINHRHSEQRCLFSLAHEVGHVLIHMSDQDFSSQFSPRSEYEKQANKFAENFLIPEKELGRRVNQADFVLTTERIRQLASDFNVSYDCMVYNLNKLGMISYKDTRSKSPEPRQEINDEVRTIKHYPAQYKLLAYYAWVKGKISISKAADFLDVDSIEAMNYFRSIANTLSGTEGISNGSNS